MTANRILWPAIVFLTAVAVPLGIWTGTAGAQPELTETNVENGDVLDTPPEMFHLCFSEPVNTQDLADYVPEQEGEVPWQFSVIQPDNRELGLRIVFQSDGECVDVFPGLSEETLEGIWIFNWMVRSQETNEEASGAITFRVGEGGSPSPIGQDNDEDDGGTDAAVIALIALGVGAVVLMVAIAGVSVARLIRSRGQGNGGQSDG